MPSNGQVTLLWIHYLYAMERYPKIGKISYIIFPSCNGISLGGEEEGNMKSDMVLLHQAQHFENIHTIFHHHHYIIIQADTTKLIVCVPVVSWWGIQGSIPK